MTAVITLTTAGADTGPFNIYSNLDSYTTPFEVNITKVSLLAGFNCSTIPEGTVSIRIKSLGVCSNFIDLAIPVTNNCIAPVLLSVNYIGSNDVTFNWSNTVGTFGTIQTEYSLNNSGIWQGGNAGGPVSPRNATYSGIPNGTPISYRIIGFNKLCTNLISNVINGGNWQGN